MRYEIDGAKFTTLEEFFDEIGRTLIPGAKWGRNLDAFNDMLRGGFGTPAGGFTIEWKNHELSKKRLSYAETIRQLELRLETCHPSNRENVLRELAAAKANRGPTVFDWLTGIIHRHGWGGTEAEDGVELLLN